MIQNLVLATEGYRISFELKPIEQRPDVFETTITFFLDPRLDMRVCPTFMDRRNTGILPIYYP
ncbi:hypothetical protein KTT_21680 [Tengunoibacter tsumagoiensis]|uniref:Uncharacterized protein n=1 Tax=Tengunoibacter tsumagoiensis TaxID=2014871 RepID=A0A401ZZP7_9CHLR|nr:hypothetical protein KTT_21680 [Tengunoibacter tsumagoiensis]